jgi:predicted nucleic-acid-binding protein
MPKNILVDLNIILDVLLQRKGYEASLAILELQGSPGCKVFISGHMVTTMAYLLEHAKVPRSKILLHIDWLLQTFLVVATTNEILNGALRSNLADYEDAVVEQAAVTCRASAIITRNVRDFRASEVKAVKPELFNIG